MHGQHAAMVRPTQEQAMVGFLDTTRSPHRDRVLWWCSKCGDMPHVNPHKPLF
jgi:hypothetical protein